MAVKVKRVPEDFVVEELTDVQPLESGKFALYRLEKRGIGTLEAIAALQQRWKLARQRLSWGGLKDKHAITRQYFTVFQGARRGITQTNFAVEFLGYTQKPFHPSDIAGNRFEIVLRNLSEEQAQTATQAIDQIQRCGIPNYFDDQRFGSVSAAGEFVAQPWIAGNYERSIWLTFAEPHPFDSSSEKQEKAILRDNWGDWAKCKAELSRSHRRSIITFLNDRPGDYKGAWATVNKDLRSLYLAAFQSQLWNETLTRVIRSIVGESNLAEVQMKTSVGVFPMNGTEEQLEQLKQLKIVLPSARISVDEIEDPLVKQSLVDVLQARGLELRAVRVKHPRDSFFSKGLRPAMIALDSIQHSVEPDDIHAYKKKLALKFDLPRGAYATMVIKRLGVEAVDLPSSDD